MCWEKGKMGNGVRLNITDMQFRVFSLCYVVFVTLS